MAQQNKPLPDSLKKMLGTSIGSTNPPAPRADNNPYSVRAPRYGPAPIRMPVGVSVPAQPGGPINTKQPGVYCSPAVVQRETLEKRIRESGDELGMNAAKPAVAPGTTTPDKPAVPFAPSVGFENIDILFETPSSAFSDPISGIYRWNIPSLNNNNQIAECATFQVFPFWIPVPNTPTNSPSPLYFQKVAIEIEEAPPTQAFTGGSGRKFHILCEHDAPTGYAVELRPQNSNSYFSPAIQSLASFTAKFLTGDLQPIAFPPQTVRVAVLATNPITFNVVDPITGDPAPAIAEFALTNNFVAPIAVRFPAPNTGSAIVDGLLTVNPVGLLISGLAGSTITIAGTSGIGAVPGSQMDMQILKNQIRIPVRFSCVRYTPTNYISVVQD